MGILNRIASEVSTRSTVTAGVSLRDPVLVSWFGGGSSTNAGENVTPDNARECPEVDACIGLNEDTIATIPLDLFERKSEDERERAVGHPLHSLMHDQPNSWQSSAEFRAMMEGFRETHGNAYARIIAGKSGFPVSLEPRHPREWHPYLTPAGVAYRWTPPDSTPRTLLQHEVLHLRDTPAENFNLAKGQSRVTRHKETIGRALATGKYLSLFFKNNATPKIGIEVPGELTTPQVEAIRQQFIDTHGGNNLGKPVVQHSGMKINAFGANNEESQVVPIYEQATAQIARIWDVPLHLIGEMSKSTSWGTGIEQQSIGFVQYYMRAKFVAWEQALNLSLMSADTRKRFYFEFNIDALLRGDFKTRMEGYALMIQWGLATPNEIRRLMNMTPVEGGNERITPLNMVPASKIMDVLLKTNSTSPQAREHDADIATRFIAQIVSSITSQEKLRLAA
ncbi:phage portal protein [Bradyrhizobium sp. AUGA SZCCT0176]|uniref:phage portal protein n=1 Tax=Bradyrhizobium sp. AUGA SZCCT0176 TaxID=2807664 RepID=UPI001BA6A378|nr:phage portal protein [Bradyrhizobium sp. AUGA SZCCT0176]MBR1230217.1 phage portal protein [Bradyrhizobium sp. AUGA SZCCT0176]